MWKPFWKLFPACTFLSQGQPPERGAHAVDHPEPPFGLTARRTGTPPDDLSNVSRSKYHWEIVIREDLSRNNTRTGLF